MPSFSIIIPVYNAENYLPRCVNSILGQTFHDFELILVDDGSSDSSPLLCDFFLSQDERIIVIHKKNGGPSSARNVGLEVAKAQFILFVDSDDWVDANYLELIEQNIHVNNADMYVLGFVIESQGSQVYKHLSSTYYKGNDTLHLIEKEMKARHWGNPWNKVFRTSFIRENNIEFNERMNYSEDALFNLEYAKFISSIESLNICGYHYINATSDKSLSQRVVLIDEFLSILNILKNEALKISNEGSWIDFLDSYIVNELIVWLYITPTKYISSGLPTLLEAIKPYNRCQLYWLQGNNRMVWNMLLKLRCPRLIYLFMIFVDFKNRI